MPILKSAKLKTSDLEKLEIQTIESGYGPVKIQTYELEMIEGCHEAERLFKSLLTNINICCPDKFGKYQSYSGNIELKPDKRMLVRLKGPYNAPIIVEEVSENYFRFATLKHHPEAGFIEFYLDKNQRDATFKIRTTTRAGDKLFNISFNYIPIGSKIQDAMWINFLENFKKYIQNEKQIQASIEKKNEEMPYSRYRSKNYFLINMPSSLS